MRPMTVHRSLAGEPAEASMRAGDHPCKSHQWPRLASSYWSRRSLKIITSQLHSNP
ncbi:hypothetical protein F2Q69_00028652 [Brassica cretica]|uniref:Uncharacterized protein n=1 Tax=Brassica cretica TaxID=69181 RepID=A0A8S9S8Z1_BRACR|nr:hypothetical protein F2Q69_00028652 [Brassica cretica]